MKSFNVGISALALLLIMSACASTVENSEIVDPATGSTAATDDPQFGLSETKNKQKQIELTANILEISKRPYGEMVISLDNDQVWIQKAPDRRFNINIGDTITIKKGKLSGYRLYRHDHGEYGAFGRMFGRIFGRGQQSTGVKRIQ
jgi:hypothetical protein